MILVLIDHDRGEVEGASFEALTLGRTLASELGRPLHSAVIGTSVRAAIEDLVRYPVANLHFVTEERLGEYAAEAWAESLAQLVTATGASVLISPGTDRGNEVMAHLAARLDAPMAANCTSVTPGPKPTPEGREALAVTRLRWGGSLLEEAVIHGNVVVLTVAPHSVEAQPPDATEPVSVTEFVPTLTDDHFRVRLTGRVERQGGGVSLTEARVVVGGGRGVGGPEGFRRLQELAGLLGAAVGCSRAVTSLGWRPHSDQVGQTGVRIAPDVYIACGISGAIQHMVGCKGAKHLIAINTDPEAPIMARADYAVIGDANAVVPAVIEELKKGRA